MSLPRQSPLASSKFRYPEVTASGARRASVELDRLETLWFNTGSLCNIECLGCYIESSPHNDRLAFLTTDEVCRFLDEIEALGLPTREIGFTGGEPFVNPQLPGMLAETLGRGFEVLILTNAMSPLMRRRVQGELLALRRRHGERLRLRVSLDHHRPEGHERLRGPRSWELTWRGLDWLAAHRFALAVAGRTCWGEDEAAARAAYGRLFRARRLPVDADDPAQLVLFPEMDASADVPEITVDCWAALKRRPADLMCASSRMVVHRQGAARAAVVSCTLLPYAAQFELGSTLAQSLGTVWLNHPHCARFCVLGGGSCSVG